ncbi:BRCA1-associated RING domain protein 1-like [Cimex lectularius]|uniref:BRCA1-associated RING domain protein 1 n=1 Tax=Cimex lectularius TaxID=79782 RepID=A0A8I6RU55_CIMLE|nr:BRCA1-associated RING domain protein 1-like [Cimex lectularius]XP_014251543.1 BRCA1-associated RING domain protein 1-like [Cimex lectularius]XP_014251544.1 BRCA1-associated RING domain protein 1-like [Cimex lectularius]
MSGQTENVQNFTNLTDAIEDFIKYSRKQQCAKCSQKTVHLYRNSKCGHPYCSDCLKTITVPVQCYVCPENVRQKTLYYDLAYKFMNEWVKNMFPAVNQDLSRNPENQWIHDYEEKDSNGDSQLSSEVHTILNNPESNTEKLTNLLKNGVNPNTLNSIQLSPLHQAIEAGNLEVLELLLAAGAQPNSYRNEESTCLHDAISTFINDNNENKETKEKIIRSLVKYGADLQARDIYGVTPKEIAEKHPVISEIINSCDEISPVPQPPRVFPPKQPTFFAFSNDSYKKKLLSTFSQMFNIQFKNVFMPTTTHFIVDRDNFYPENDALLAILSQCQFITMDWILYSVAFKRIQPLDMFEPTGTHDCPGSDCFKKSRMNYLTMKPRLFTGGSFYLSDPVKKKNRMRYEKIIKTGGGIVLSSVPQSSDTDEKVKTFLHGEGTLKKCSTIVLHTFKTAKFKSTDRIKHFPIQWIHEAIETFSVKDPSQALMENLMD